MTVTVGPLPRSGAALALLGGLLSACGGGGTATSTSVPVSAQPSLELHNATGNAYPGASAAPSSSPVPSPTGSTPGGGVASCDASTALSQWSNERLAWQVIAVPAQANALGNVRAEVAAGAGAILLFGATGPPDLAAQLSGLGATAPGGIAPLVMSDVEGGAVERVANLVGPIPSARRMAQTMSAAQIRAYATGVGRRLRTLGITMDLAPVMDLDSGYGPTSSNPDGTRSFSGYPAVAAADAQAFATGLSAAGVVPVAKHFPGLHGEGDNTDLGPARTLPWSTLQGGGLVPFRTAIANGLPAVMLSNASVPGLSALPAGISPQVVGALRNQLGFHGLILTDSLTAGAITRTGLSFPEAAAAALVAGADLVLYDAQADVAGNAHRAVAAISDAVSSGRLPRAQLISSVGRVLRAKHLDPCGAH